MLIVSTEKSPRSEGTLRGLSMEQSVRATSTPISNWQRAQPIACVLQSLRAQGLQCQLEEGARLNRFQLSCRVGHGLVLLPPHYCVFCERFPVLRKCLDKVCYLQHST